MGPSMKETNVGYYLSTSVSSKFLTDYEFTEVLITLGKLHIVCNDDYLCANYQKVIEAFSHVWYKLSNAYKISTTPKLHIVSTSVVQFVRWTGKGI